MAAQSREWVKPVQLPTERAFTRMKLFATILANGKANVRNFFLDLVKAYVAVAREVWRRSFLLRVFVFH